MLRRSATRGVLMGDTAKLHLDADALNAFAENALPEKSRRIYTEHLAECDPCRKTLSSMILMNAEAEPELAAATVAPSVSATILWYRKLFTTPNLAYTFGGLILFFGGLIGFVAFQNMSSGDLATVSQIAGTQAEREPDAFDAPMATASNSNATSNAANTSSNTAGEIPRSVGSSDMPTESDAGIVSAPPPPAPMLSVPATGSASNSASSPIVTDGVSVAGGQPAPKEVAKSSADESRMRVEDKRELNEQEARKQDADAKNVREQQLNQMSPGSGNTKDSGPSRSTIQRDNRSYNDGPAMKAKKAESPAPARGDSTSGRRTVGGKTFELKQGAWYDTTFRGQSTKNVRRGTDEYRKLDGGLRSIADSIGGLVVVVWNGKAYRIQ